MNRLREKTTATILIAIFMISTFAVAAYAVEGTHLISTGSIGQANEDRIVIDMPLGFKLGDLDSIAWSEYLVMGYPPHVDVILDLDGGGYGAGDDALVFEYAYNALAHYAENGGQMPYGAVTGGWYPTFDDDGAGHSVITGVSMAWATKGAPGSPTASSPNFFFHSLADWKAGVTYTASGQATKTIDSDSIVLRLEIEVDNYVVDCEAYVKDIVVNSQTVSLLGEAMTPTVSISVSPPTIDFGPLVLGKSYEVQDVTIDNTGQTDILLTAELYTDDGFYARSLRLDTDLVTAWGETMTEMQVDIIVDLDLVVDRSEDPGVHTATLVFWAEEDP